MNIRSRRNWPGALPKANGSAATPSARNCCCGACNWAAGDYGIVGALALNWFRKRRPDARFNVGIALVTEPTRCVLVESPGFPLAQVLRAIKRLADKGELQRLPLRYRPDH